MSFVISALTIFIFFKFFLTKDRIKAYAMEYLKSTISENLKIDKDFLKQIQNQNYNLSDGMMDIKVLENMNDFNSQLFESATFEKFKDKMNHLVNITGNIEEKISDLLKKK